MHILFLTDNFPPEVNAPASRTYEHCREWVKAGHRVTVVTCAPNFPAGKVFDGYRNKLWQRETMDGINVIRVWSYITANEGFVRRVADYISFMVMAIPASVLVRKPDVVVGTSPQFFTACAGYVVGVLKRRPFVFELRDIWPESIRAVGVMKHSRLLDLLERLELFLYRRAQKIISVTHAFKANLQQRGIDGSKISVVRNGVDLDRFGAMPRDKDLAEKLGLTGKFVVGYIGTHGLAHGLNTLLDAAAILQNQDAKAPQVCFVFLGDGAQKIELQQRAADMGLGNVLFLDSVSRTEVARYWSLLDATVIHLKKTPLFETVIPSKIFECLAMGVPILHGVAGESAEIVEATKAGLVFEPENSEALAKLIVSLQQNPDLQNSLRENGLKAAPGFDRSHLAMDMLQHLQDAAAGK